MQSSRASGTGVQCGKIGCAGDGCVMCEDVHLPEHEHSFLVSELEQTYVRFPRNQYVSGWTILVLKRHASELYELSSDELAGFWKETSVVAEALNEIYAPAKMNYMVFGNRCPHIHSHLFPVTYDHDPFQPINMQEQEVFLEEDEYREIIENIRRRLPDPK